MWALGATLYAAVEGVAPFRRTSTWSTLNAIVVDPLPEPRRAGPLAPALRELMDKDPARRADAARAAALLAAVAAGTGSPPGSDTMRLGAAGTGQPSGQAVQPAQGAGPHPGQNQQGPPEGPGPGAGAPGGPYGSHTDPHTVPTGGAPARTRRRRAVIAAVAAAVVLTGAGVTYAVTAGNSGGENRASDSRHSGGETATGADGQKESKDSGPASTSSAPSPGGSAAGGHKDGAAAGGSSGRSDGKGAHGGDGTSAAPGNGAHSGSHTGGGGGSGGAGNGTSAGGSGGGDPAPPPACHSAGGGKYNCSVWKTATSYSKKHEAVGRLNAGTNYFFCQAKLSHRETSGRWTNVWWARTDDDSGNKDVFVSDVYIRGGDNDQPLPGLPTC